VAFSRCGSNPLPVTSRCSIDGSMWQYSVAFCDVSGAFLPVITAIEVVSPSRQWATFTVV